MTLTATVTDGDGDKASQSLDLGSKATFHDDGPVFNSVMDAIVANQAGTSFTGTYNAAFGADGLDHLSLALLASGAYSGSAVTFVQSTSAGVTTVQVQDATTHAVQFTFYYTEDAQPDGGVLTACLLKPRRSGRQRLLRARSQCERNLRLHLKFADGNHHHDRDWRFRLHGLRWRSNIAHFARRPARHHWRSQRRYAASQGVA
ncbi:hypothetical protein ACVOMV_18955 [Mesorhizobium atlanticum]